jgi:hypothetical protein
MLIGGIIPTFQIYKHAEEKNIKVVISTSFESQIGRRVSVYCSSFIKNVLTHGLNTSNIFTDDPTQDIYPVKNGKIKIMDFKL